MLCCGNKDNETNTPSRFTIERELKHLSALIARSPTDHSLITNYEKKKEIKNCEASKNKGCNSKVADKMDGGGGKKYKILPQFREKRATIKTIYQIKNEQGEICKNQTKVLSEIQKHFKDMYKRILNDYKCGRNN